MLSKDERVARTAVYVRDELCPDSSGHDAEEYFARDTTTINHFHEKLLLFKDRMNTASARTVAERRHEVLLGFLREFSAERDGCDVADSLRVSDFAWD